MPFQYTFRSDDITTWDAPTRDLLENRDRELELYSTTIDTSFLNLNASNLTSGTVPSARMSGSYTGITGLGTLTGLTIGGAGANRVITINAPTGYYAIQYFQIGGVFKWHYEVNPAGDRWSLVQTGVAERIGVTSTGATFSGTVTATTFSGALSGNASTATNLSTNRNDWSTNGTISAVVGQLAWKNYGNGHTIFDASNSTSPSGGAVNNTNAAIAWTGTYPTLMGWNGSNTYGVRVDSARIADIASSVGTLAGLTSSSRIWAQTDLRVGNANSAVLTSSQFTLIVTPQAYTSLSVNIGELWGSSGIAGASGNFSIGAPATTSFINPANGNTAAYITNVDGEYYGRSNIRIFTAGANFIAQSPSTGSGFAAQWVSAFGVFVLFRNTSTRNDKENIQPLNGIVTPSMIDDINVELWNRKGAEGIPEIGPMAEDMNDISPFLSIRGMDCDDEGNIVATDPTGINQNGWLSLLTLSVQDIRKRLQQLETA
jgi:hypothetical protein